MDKYDVTLDVCISSVLSQSMVLTPQVNNTRVLKVVLDNRINPWFSSIILRLLLAFHMQQVTENVDVCIEDETVNYLNRRDVQKALHANLVGVNRWLVCSK